ncbi:MAG: hypothetical protein AMXMBFR53_38010 [Gemmatimonadota bacterium]
MLSSSYGNPIDGEGVMSRVTVSSKYQVVIPKDVRDRLKIRPGQKVEAFAIGERIELVPVRPIRELRGALRGVEARFEREPDRDL